MAEKTQNNQLEEALKRIGDLEEKLKSCAEEKDKFLSGWQRERADFQNYKKDELKRLSEFTQTAVIPVFKDIINWLDELETINALLKNKLSELEMNGINLIIKNFKDILNKYGIEQIKVQIRDVFNPALHEAIETIAGEEDNKIIEVLAKGYTLERNILRPAKVKVSIKKNL